METKTQERSQIVVVSPALEKMAQLAKRHGWDIVIEPVYEKGWTEEILESESTLPDEGVKRLRIAQGVPNKGFVVAHEPTWVPRPTKEPEYKPPDIDWKGAATTVAKVLAIAAGVVLAVAAVVAFLQAIVIFVVAGALATAIAADPALICLVDNGDNTVTRVQIYFWEE